MNKELMFSSEVHTYSTPQWLFDKLNSQFNFTLDACADKSNHKCDKYYTENDNGLIQNWNDETVWINPPYGQMQKTWVRKAYDEFVNNNATCVLLIPARVDTALFHDLIFPHATQIQFLKGRLKFSGHKNSAPFPSAIVIFDGKSDYADRFIWADYRT